MSYFEQSLPSTIDQTGEKRLADAQYPIPTEGISRIYVKDLDIANSDNGGFLGTVADYFNSLKTVNSDVSATNPKVITLRFQSSIQISEVGFGCDDPLQNFSNIKIEILGSADAVRGVFDESGDNTKRNSFVADFAPETANGLIITFATADPVGLSNLIVYKANNVVARIQALKDNGTLGDAAATNRGNLKVAVQEYGDTPSIDAFAALRVSEKFTLFDSKQLHDKQPLFWDESIGGSATSVHSSVDANTAMTVTASASDFVIRQTKQRFNYQPGKGQLMIMTFHSGTDVGTTKRVGAFDGTGTNNLTPNNGIFFETNSDQSWNIAKDGSTTETVIQANWNLDTLDGSEDEGNPSGITFDPDGAQILFFDYEWLGVGRVRVGFFIGGLPIYVHEFNHSNDASFPSVYMSTPNLPLRYDITSDGSGGGTLDHICSTVVSEGGIEKTGVLRSVETRNTFSNTLGGGAGTKHALCGIRLKSAYLDISVIPESITIVLDSNDEFKWELHLNPTIGGTWTYNDLTDSSVQFAQVGAATNNTISADGIIIARGGASNQSRGTTDSLNTALRIGSTIAGTQDELVLVIGLLSNNQTVWGSLDFRELL